MKAGEIKYYTESGGRRSREETLTYMSVPNGMMPVKDEVSASQVTENIYVVPII